MKKTTFTPKRLALNAMLVALYYLLGLMKIPIGNLLRVNLASFAVVICATTFGPIDGLLVGFLGEFLSQILGPYGLTPTTALWAMPEAIRGVLLGLSMVLFIKKGLCITDLIKSKHTALYLGANVVAGIIASLANTFALYVDSKMMGYYSYYMVFGILVVRLILAVVLSAVLGYIALPIIAALRHNKN